MRRVYAGRLGQRWEGHLEGGGSARLFQLVKRDEHARVSSVQAVTGR